MEIVINISEDDYDRIVHIVDAAEPSTDDWKNRVMYAIKNSIPLSEYMKRFEADNG